MGDTNGDGTADRAGGEDSSFPEVTPTGQQGQRLLPTQFTGKEGVGPLSARVIVIYAILVAAVGFVPVPVLDDLLPKQLIRHLIRTILRLAGRRYSTRFVRPLYAGEGCISGLFWILLMLPLDILLYPIRKAVRIIKGVRALSQRLVSTYLLGHTVSRYVAKDWLGQSCDRDTLHYQSRLLRDAFDVALERTNPVVFSSSVAALLGGLQGLPRAAWRAARRLLKHRGPAEARAGAESPTAAPAAAEREEPVASAATRVEHALDMPAVRAFLVEFDAVVDEEVMRALAASSKPGAVPPRGPHEAPE